MIICWFFFGVVLGVNGIFVVFGGVCGWIDWLLIVFVVWFFDCFLFIVLICEFWGGVMDWVRLKVY